MEPTPHRDPSTRLFDRWAPVYDLTAWYMRRVQRFVLGALDVGPGDRLLDVACGTGYLLSMAGSPSGSGRRMGVDRSGGMLAQARAKAPKTGGPAFFRAEAARLPFRGESFDRVACTAAFHHFPDPKAAVGEMARVLAPEGALALADLHVPPLWLTNRIGRLEPGFVAMYEPAAIVGMMERSGLAVRAQHRLDTVEVVTVAAKP